MMTVVKVSQPSSDGGRIKGPRALPHPNGIGVSLFMADAPSA
jgi:hypothetical protein